MSRRTFIFWVALPLALLMLVLVAWARSYRVMDEWSMATDKGEVRGLIIYQGAFHYLRSGTTAATRPVSYDSHEIPAGSTMGDLYTGGGVAWHWLGFWKIDARGAPVWNSASARAYRLAPWVFSGVRQAWVVPFWPLVAVTGLPWARWGWKAWRVWRRRRRGLCPRCGYDLRGTPGRCAECGWTTTGPRGGR